VRALLALAMTMAACATPGPVAQAPAAQPPPAAPPPSTTCPKQLPAFTERAIPFGANVARVCLVGATEDDYLRLHEFVAPREGLPLTAEAVRADIEGLHAMGFVKDVIVVAEPLDEKQVALIYAVAQYDRVSAVKLEGAKVLTLPELEDLAKRGLPANPALARAIEVGVRELYEQKGYAHAEVDVRVTTLGQGNAALTVTVNEGPRVTISAITFAGAKQVSAAELRRAVSSAVGAVYSREAVDRDALALLAVYFDRGMVNARVDSEEPREVRGAIELTFTIIEGDVFRVGKVALKGTPLGPEKDVLKSLMTRPGFVFSRAVVRADLERLRELGRRRGLQLEVTPLTEIKAEAQRIDLTFELEARPPTPAGE
jgi:outer membrane protein insertion porin family